MDWLAERGILAAPGAFYGPAGGRHVRVALTATDERIAAAAARLAAADSLLDCRRPLAVVGGGLRWRDAAAPLTWASSPTSRSTREPSSTRRL